MPFCRLTRRAERDLDEIAAYIAVDNPRAASLLLQRTEELFDSLSVAPKIGRLRPEIAPDLRSFAEGNYVIFYRSVEDGIVVSRILHGARNLPNQSYPDR